jgi:cullin-4
MLPASYEGIYNACRSVVTISHLGHDLHDILKLELEKSIGNLANELHSSAENDTTWIISFNETFKWLEEQIVGSN